MRWPKYLAAAEYVFVCDDSGGRMSRAGDPPGHSALSRGVGVSNGRVPGTWVSVEWCLIARRSQLSDTAEDTQTVAESET